MNGTSLIADHVSVSGLRLLMSDTSGSPDQFVDVCNISDLAVPMTATEVLVTNVSDTWVRRVPTLLDMGKVTAKLFWVMAEPSHASQPGGSGVATGMRYLFVNKILRDWLALYPDGRGSADAFSAYVTSFQITAKVGGVFEASCGLGTTGVPSLV